MRCGISTACFFPESTLDSLCHVIDTGAGVTEVFLNTFHELEDAYIAKLDAAVRAAGVEVVSVHPFSSAMEGFFFASEYEGRLRDGLDLYRRFFTAAARLGAKYLVFHGDHANNPANFSDGRYAEHFCRVAQLGREYGVVLCHENVFYCRLNAPERVREIRPLLGEYAAFVLDTKQLQRQGASLPDMLDAMGEDIRHVHLSDWTQGADCIPPGKGEFDTEALLRHLEGWGYMGDIVLELYRSGFENAGELAEGMQYVNGLVQKVTRRRAAR